MQIFSCTGSGIRDLWLVDGSADFGFFPQSLMRELNASTPLPIRLHVGNRAFGQVHIDQKHGHWLATLKSDAAALVWAKLKTPAQVYASDKAGALKLSFRFAPEALMVLEYREASRAYLSVVTLYQHPRHVDGQHLGRYRPASR
jgi:hypothetical protein